MRGFSTQFLVIGDTIMEEKQARTDVSFFFRSFIPIFGQNIIRLIHVFCTQLLMMFPAKDSYIREKSNPISGKRKRSKLVIRKPSCIVAVLVHLKSVAWCNQKLAVPLKNSSLSL